jgi:hypothetical protein
MIPDKKDGAVGRDVLQADGLDFRMLRSGNRTEERT